MCRALGLLRICSLIGVVKGLNPGVINRWSMIVWAIIVLNRTFLTVTDVSTTCVVEAFELCTSLNFIAAMIFLTLNSCCR